MTNNVNGTLLLGRNTEATIEVTESFDTICTLLLVPGEFIAVTDPVDGPYLLRRDLIDVATAKPSPEPTETETSP